MVSDKVLLVKYANVTAYDGQKGWFLPDDLLRHEEHPDAAARRILRDQLGCDRLPLRLDHIESFGGGRWHLIFHYRSEPSIPPTIQAGANVTAASWFPLDQLPPRDEMAHEGWAQDVLRRIVTRSPPP